MQTKQKHGDKTAGPTSQQDANEFIYYYINLLKLFRDTKPIAEIDRLASEAMLLRRQRIYEFGQHLTHIESFFRASLGERPLEPRLTSWNLDQLQSLREMYGSLLLAVFHFGEHRHVLSDLAALGIPFVAPIAKHAYFDATAIFRNGPPASKNAAMMLEVERRDVGRRLLGGLKAGRVGVIYVDGNMGPDGHMVEESAVEVDFLGLKIRVKSGIARLASSLSLPVVPMLAQRSGKGGALLPVIVPRSSAKGAAREHEIVRIMQECYTTLGKAVSASPQDWEFAFCLHRWISVDPSSQQSDRPALAQTSSAKARIDPKNVVYYPRSDGIYWLHVEKQRAYKLPSWCGSIYHLLTETPQELQTLMTLLQERAPANETTNIVEQLHSLGLIDVTPDMQ